MEELNADDAQVKEMISKTLARPAVLRNFYCFQGTRTEFAQRATDQQTRRESCLKTFSNLAKDGYGKLELINLQNWYKEFRFSNIDAPVEDNERFVWHFCTTLYRASISNSIQYTLLLVSNTTLVHWPCTVLGYTGRLVIQ